MGYERLDPSAYSSSEEEDITGELERQIEGVLDDVAAPRWCDRYDVAEEKRIHAHNRLGKRRRRVDIEIQCAHSRPRPRIQFEGKRLRARKSLNEYLGEEGLGCFFAGQDAYARTHEEAGMLGYVQVEDQGTWADRIAARLQATPKSFHLTHDGKWSEMVVKGGPKYTYRTRHSRKDPPRPIAIFHVLLRFH